MANTNDLNIGKYDSSGRVMKKKKVPVSLLVQNTNDSENGSFDVSTGRKNISLT